MAQNFPTSPSNGDTFTANGVVFVYNSTKGVWAKQGTTTPPVVSGHVLPDTTLTYDLGSADKKFRDIYLSSGTIYLGDENLSITDGQLTSSASIASPDLDVSLIPENMELIVNANEGGGGTNWFWTWGETLLYGRGSVTNSSAETEVPLYR